MSDETKIRQLVRRAWREAQAIDRDLGECDRVLACKRSRIGAVTRTIARTRLVGKMAHDDLICPPPVSACDYPARCLALSMDGPRDARASSAIWPTLGCSYLFGLWRNFVADLDEIRGLAPNYLGGLGSPIEPAGLASSGPTGLPSCVRLPSHSRNLWTPGYQAALR